MFNWGLMMSVFLMFWLVMAMMGLSFKKRILPILLMIFSVWVTVDLIRFLITL